MEISTFLSAAIVAGTPLLFATLGELITERAGHLNLGVEGMMLMGAVIGFQVGYATGNPYMALLGAALAGALISLIYGFLTVTLRTNQIVTGLSLTIFGSGLASFLGQKFVGKVTPEKIVAFFSERPIPVLSNIPIFGNILFNHGLFVYLGYLTAIVLGIYLYKTRFGLNLRMVGESAAAADAAGVHVMLYKYFHILLGGALCGLGGAYLSLVYVPSWQDNVTAGRGWIAVALVIFCTWSPYKAVLGAYLFGGLDIIGFRLQTFNIQISQYLVDMLPYIVTILIIVVSSIRKSRKNAPPAGLGLEYFREDR